MERGSPFHSEKFFNEHNSAAYLGENFCEDMTLDSGPSEEDNKEHIQLLELDCENADSCTIELNSFASVDHHDVIKGERGPNNFLENVNSFNEKKINLDDKSKVQLNNSCSEPVRSESDTVKCDKFNNSDFTISNSVNSMKSIRMNIRRKRFCSNSSAVSNNDSVSEEKRPCRRLKKRRKRKTYSNKRFSGDCNDMFLGYVKDDNILTSSDQYVTHSGEVAFGLINEQQMAMEMAAAAADSANLEVNNNSLCITTKKNLLYL